ncbi:hypothetical protein EQ836_10875 [Ectopseudomonas mendocina]|uniref:Type IV pilus assembly protein PilW n=1 Tax=Ectopseudomonas mendocina TaxID=300 RepID=A0ABD7RXI2_ECTME|nr:PilW family protein [Pseudomonas mendocina]TRO15274.1 hypothetical protein EQ829_08075 [Pseudomonas mendocina]TRO18427.1 hypothetical protein EQ836_10875 [Pseudomonas mendocina]
MNYRESIQLSKQRGLSIVELLVALVISMLLLTGVVQVFFSSKQTYASNEAASRLQENGRFALEFIAQSARHAGYVEAANTTTTAPLPIASTKSPENDICKDTNTCSTIGNAAAPNVADRSDRIGFVLQPRFQDGLRRNCLGKETIGARAINNTDLIINQFLIVGANNDLALACRSQIVGTNNVEEQRLIDGIDAMQVQYGISTNGDRSSVNQYVSADRVTALNRWNDVVAIRIAVLANSVEPVNPPAPARQYVLLDAPPILIDDGRARQVFTTTIKLRNTF